MVSRQPLLLVIVLVLAALAAVVGCDTFRSTDELPYTGPAAGPADVGQGDVSSEVDAVSDPDIGSDIDAGPDADAEFDADAESDVESDVDVDVDAGEGPLELARTNRVGGTWNFTHVGSIDVAGVPGQVGSETPPAMMVVARGAAGRHDGHYLPFRVGGAGTLVHGIPSPLAFGLPPGIPFGSVTDVAIRRAQSGSNPEFAVAVVIDAADCASDPLAPMMFLGGTDFNISTDSYTPIDNDGPCDQRMPVFPDAAIAGEPDAEQPLRYLLRSALDSSTGHALAINSLAFDTAHQADASSLLWNYDDHIDEVPGLGILYGSRHRLAVTSAEQTPAVRGLVVVDPYSSWNQDAGIWIAAAAAGTSVDQAAIEYIAGAAEDYVVVWRRGRTVRAVTILCENLDMAPRCVPVPASETWTLSESADRFAVAAMPWGFVVAFAEGREVVLRAYDVNGVGQYMNPVHDLGLAIWGDKTIHDVVMDVDGNSYQIFLAASVGNDAEPTDILGSIFSLEPNWQ